MNLTPKIQKSINKAAELQPGQVQKLGNLPHIIHSNSVVFSGGRFTNKKYLE